MVGLKEERTRANKAIAKLLAYSKIGQKYPRIIDSYEWLTQEYPNQRCAQIFCNYICSDYENKHVSDETKEIMEYLFPNNPDPFYEEPYHTYNRLIKKSIDEITKDNFEPCLDKEYFIPYEILKSDEIPEDIKNEVLSKVGDEVFFELGEKCKTGLLVGIRVRNSSIRYHFIIISKDGETLYIPFNHSITLLKQ